MTGDGFKPIGIAIVLVLLLFFGTGIWYYASGKPALLVLKTNIATNAVYQGGPVADPNATPLNNFPETNQSWTWNTYKNNMFHYQISYPSNWQYDEQKLDSASGVQGISFTGPGSPLSLLLISNDPNPYHHNTLMEYNQFLKFVPAESSRDFSTINGKQVLGVIFPNNGKEFYFMRDSDKMVFDIKFWVPLTDSALANMLNSFQY